MGYELHLVVEGAEFLAGYASVVLGVAVHVNVERPVLRRRRVQTNDDVAL